MDALALIEQARDAGLKLTIADGTLAVKGPRRLSWLVNRIAAHKQAVIDALTGLEGNAPALDPQHSSPVGETETPKTAEDQRGFADSPPVFYRSKGGLIGCGFPPRPTEIPPETILSKPLPVCPRCSSRPVLLELRTITGRLCWTCSSWGSGATS